MESLRLVLAPLLNQVQQHLEHWQAQLLSFWGRLILIKAVLAALPSYLLRCTVIPVSVLGEIERKMRNFLWSPSASSQGLYLLSWDQVCQPWDFWVLGLHRLTNLAQAYKGIQQIGF